MVERQLRGRDVEDERVLRAMERVPRPARPARRHAPGAGASGGRPQPGRPGRPPVRPLPVRAARRRGGIRGRMSNRFDRSGRGTRAAAMRRFSSGDLRSLPIRLHGIELGRAVDLIVELETMRVLGLDVRCRDDTHRFLPLAAARVGEAEIAIGSALLLLDELPFYRARGRVRRQPRRLHDPPALGGTALPRRRGLLVRGGGDEQLPAEPPLDLPRRARPLRLPGAAVPRRLGAGTRREPDLPARPRRARPREDRRPGARDRARHAAQLRRQQALVVPPPLMRRAAVAALAALVLAPAALAAPTPTSAVYDSKGQLVQTEFAPPDTSPNLSKKKAGGLGLRFRKVAG